MGGEEKMVLGTEYITQEGRKNLHNYKYSGSDNSLIYKHVLTPMNNALIPLFPLWMAPNLITLIGLIITFATYLVTDLYAPTFEGVAPAWVYVFCGIGLFTYQTLDNLDGKQARRTGTSSPLGLLFDHGCDALNCTVSTCTFLSIIQMGMSWKVRFTIVPFSRRSQRMNRAWQCGRVRAPRSSSIHGRSITQTVRAVVGEALPASEKKQRSSNRCTDLYLPVINGPTEGLLFAVTCDFATAYFGPQLWTQPAPIYPEHLQVND